MGFSNPRQTFCLLRSNLDSKLSFSKRPIFGRGGTKVWNFILAPKVCLVSDTRSSFFPRCCLLRCLRAVRLGVGKAGLT